VPSNEQRRDAAKRKLERQLEQRARRDRKRRQLTIAGSVVGALLVIGAVVGVFTMSSDHSDRAASTTTGNSDTATTSPNAPGQLPPVKPAAATVSCTYPATPGYRGKAWKLPHTTGVKTIDNGAPIAVSVSMVTSRGDIGLMLRPSESPCAVNSFASLIGQGFFDKTSCQQLTDTPAGSLQPVHVLECGDPTGTGTGGPGYSFAPEYPRNQYTDADPGLQTPVDYKRGTLAMFSSDTMPQGSQFFLVFGDSQLPPDFTILGTVDATGLQTLDRVGAAGALPLNPKTHLAAPKLPVTITSMRLDVG
jgi:peptidyl-prolyl cis-trans isomerase B (cyclophilin B)